MKRPLKWEIRVSLGNDVCPFRHNGKCSLLKCDENQCEYINCPRRIPITCKDCRYLFFNQNPTGPLTKELSSSCGMKEYKIIFTDPELQKEHYKRPEWCPANKNVSDKEIFTRVKE